MMLARHAPNNKYVHHYFFRKKYSFFSEEIMRHAGVTPNSQRFIISSENDERFLLKR
jgi:hypothetical protein